MQPSFETAIEALDLSVFSIESQTSAADRRSLLALQRAVRGWKDSYIYLECGSHLGGSLVPHLLDPRCRLALSVDKRPVAQPDERGVMFNYPANSTRRVLEGLSARVPKQAMLKLRTWDADASELSRAEVATQPDLVFIDAEHTTEAVFRDFVSLYALCGIATIYAFHDSNLVFGGLQNVETFLRYLKIAFTSFVLPDCVFVLATAAAQDVIVPLGKEFAIDRAQFAKDAQLGLMQAHHEHWQARIFRPAPAQRSERRNAPCPCGSGKRYKHCHGAQA